MEDVSDDNGADGIEQFDDTDDVSMRGLGSWVASAGEAAAMKIPQVYFKYFAKVLDKASTPLLGESVKKVLRTMVPLGGELIGSIIESLMEHANQIAETILNSQFMIKGTVANFKNLLYEIVTNIFEKVLIINDQLSNTIPVVFSQTRDIKIIDISPGKNTKNLNKILQLTHKFVNIFLKRVEDNLKISQKNISKSNETASTIYSIYIDFINTTKSIIYKIQNTKFLSNPPNWKHFSEFLLEPSKIIMTSTLKITEKHIKNILKKLYELRGIPVIFKHDSSSIQVIPAGKAIEIANKIISLFPAGNILYIPQKLITILANFIYGITSSNILSRIYSILIIPNFIRQRIDNIVVRLNQFASDIRTDKFITNPPSLEFAIEFGKNFLKGCMNYLEYFGTGNFVPIIPSWIELPLRFTIPSSILTTVQTCLILSAGTFTTIIAPPASFILKNSFEESDLPLVQQIAVGASHIIDFMSAFISSVMGTKFFEKEPTVKNAIDTINRTPWLLASTALKEVKQMLDEIMETEYY